MNSKTLLLLLPVCFNACTANSNSGPGKGINPPTIVGQNINPYPAIAAIPLPNGFSRPVCDSGSFAWWLRKVELKKDKTVFLFNGDQKANQSAQFAVLNISTGHKDLQQCADAVMRLRAEYLFATGQYDDIRFTDNANTHYIFTAPYNNTHLHNYLEKVFGMCGTASLSKQLKAVMLESIEPGDVLIRGGFPGHAVLVMDVAVNAAGHRRYLLAQGYMPAQDMHVLVNPADENLSPWYEVNSDEKIYTPEYIFNRNELKRW